MKDVQIMHFLPLILFPLLPIALAIKGGLDQKKLKLLFPMVIGIQFEFFLMSMLLIGKKTLTQEFGWIYFFLSIILLFQLKVMKSEKIIRGIFFTSMFLEMIYLLKIIPTQYEFAYLLSYSALFSLGLNFFLHTSIKKFERKELLNQHFLIQKSLEEKLFSSLKQSEIASLLPGVLHELSHPLMVMNARMTQLKRTLAGPEFESRSKVYFDQIKFHIEEMSRIVHHTREFIYQKDSGVKSFSISNLITRVLSFWDQRLKNHGINFRVFHYRDQEIYSNPSDVEQMFLILIHVAFEHLEYLSQKWIELTIEEENEFIVFTFTTSVLKEDLELPLEFNFFSELAAKNKIEIGEVENTKYCSWFFKIQKSPSVTREIEVYH